MSSRLSNRKMSSAHRFDQEGRLRVICKPFAVEGIVDAAFNMIRQNSQSVAAVSIYLLETIATVAAQTSRKEDCAALSRHAAMVVHGCKEKLSADDDREDLEKRYEAAFEILNGAPIRTTLNPEADSRQKR